MIYYDNAYSSFFFIGCENRTLKDHFEIIKYSIVTSVISESYWNLLNNTNLSPFYLVSKVVYKRQTMMISERPVTFLIIYGYNLNVYLV